MPQFKCCGGLILNFSYLKKIKKCISFKKFKQKNVKLFMILTFIYKLELYF